MRSCTVPCLLLAACAPPAAPAPPPPPTIEIPLQPEAPAPTEEFEARATDAGTVTLREEWASTQPIVTPVDDQLHEIAPLRDAFERQTKTAVTGGADAVTEWVKTTNAIADRLSRSYASAFRARDATDEQRVEIALAAAEVALLWFRRLDEMGFAKTPSAWRADPKMPLTFEEVSAGIGTRWRDEGLALVALCVSTAKAANVDTPAAKLCSQMYARYGRVAIAKAAPPPPATCRCARGDPLCSSDEWCD